MKRLPCLFILLPACMMRADDLQPSSLRDGGADQTANADPSQLCASAACAAAPCAAGCVFVARFGVCDPATPSAVATATVRGCRAFCGKFDLNPFQVGTGCSIYNGARPGCEVCGFRWGAPSCYDVSPRVDYQHGGAICSSPYTCFDGSPPGDMDPGCGNKDMFPPRDWGGIDLR